MHHLREVLDRALFSKVRILVQHVGTGYLANQATKDILHTSLTRLLFVRWYVEAEKYHNFPFLSGYVRNRNIKWLVQNDIGICCIEESHALFPMFQTTYLLDICPKKLKPLFYALLWCSNWWNLKKKPKQSTSKIQTPMIFNKTKIF